MIEKYVPDTVIDSSTSGGPPAVDGDGGEGDTDWKSTSASVAASLASRTDSAKSSGVGRKAVLKTGT